MNTPEWYHNVKFDEETSQMSLSEKTKELFENFVSTGKSGDDTSDVTLVASDQRKFYCHKYVLAARSNVFKTMLYSKKRFEENLENVVKIVKI